MILQKDNKILRQKAKEVPVEEIKGAKIKRLLKEMAEVLANSKYGVALAAPQVGKPLRLFIVDRDVWEKKNKKNEEYSPSKRPPIVFINPEIKKISKKKRLVAEGCLSAENIYGTMKRAEKLTVEALDENGKKFFRGAAGFLAQIIQHEMDHLEGVLFIDKAIKLERVTSDE